MIAHPSTFSRAAAGAAAAVAFLALGWVPTLLVAQDSTTPTPQPYAVPPPATPAELAMGKTLYATVCTQCHGAKGEGSEPLKSPSIASLPGWYINIQIKNFREGRRGTDPRDVQGVLMSTIAKVLTDDQVRAVGHHVERMPLVVPQAAVAMTSGDSAPAPAKPEAPLWEPGDAESGKMLFEERCMECHRYNASGELAFGSPPLVGRQPWYLEAQIRKFKNGMRGAIPGDVNGAKMVFSSSFIEDQQAMRDVVTYIMTLNPSPDGSGTDVFGVPAASDSSSPKDKEDSHAQASR